MPGHARPCQPVSRRLTQNAQIVNFLIRRSLGLQLRWFWFRCWCSGRQAVNTFNPKHLFSVQASAAMIFASTATATALLAITSSTLSSLWRVSTAGSRLASTTRASCAWTCPVSKRHSTGTKHPHTRIQMYSFVWHIAEVKFKLLHPKPPESVCSLPCERGQAKRYVEGESCCWHCFNCTTYQVSETSASILPAAVQTVKSNAMHSAGRLI